MALANSLGSNVGSDVWLEQKTKQVKMLEFASQINHINKSKLQSETVRRPPMKALEHAQGYKKRFDYDRNLPKATKKQADDLLQDLKMLEDLESM